jgi:hypothetical protein
MRANAGRDPVTLHQRSLQAAVMKDDTVAGLVVGFYRLVAQKYLCSPSVKKKIWATRLPKLSRTDDLLKHHHE